MRTCINSRFAALGFAWASLYALAQTPAPANPAHTFAPKVSLYSEYEYRGIAQTAEKPAVQFNLDYMHSSGIYVGAFASDVSWISDTIKEIRRLNPPASQFTGGAGKVEVDLFGGYKYTQGDITLDIGYLRYQYPSSSAIIQTQAGRAPFTVLKKPNTDELFVGAAYGPVSFKYSRTLSEAFGLPDTKGSSFVELNFAKEIVPRWTLNGQLGRQTYKNFSGGNYSVYKLGATYDIGDGWNAGGYVKNTNADPTLYTYAGKDFSSARLVAFVSKAF